MSEQRWDTFPLCPFYCDCFCHPLSFPHPLSHFPLAIGLPSCQQGSSSVLLPPGSLKSSNSPFMNETCSPLLNCVALGLSQHPILAAPGHHTAIQPTFSPHLRVALAWGAQGRAFVPGCTFNPPTAVATLRRQQWLSAGGPRVSPMEKVMVSPAL